MYDFARTFIEIVTNQVLGHFKKIQSVHPNCKEISLETNHFLRVVQLFLIACVERSKCTMTLNYNPLSDLFALHQVQSACKSKRNIRFSSSDILFTFRQMKGLAQRTYLLTHCFQSIQNPVKIDITWLRTHFNEILLVAFCSFSAFCIKVWHQLYVP